MPMAIARVTMAIAPATMTIARAAADAAAEGVADADETATTPIADPNPSIRDQPISLATCHPEICHRAICHLEIYRVNYPNPVNRSFQPHPTWPSHRTIWTMMISHPSPVVPADVAAAEAVAVADRAAMRVRPRLRQIPLSKTKRLAPRKPQRSPKQVPPIATSSTMSRSRRRPSPGRAAIVIWIPSRTTMIER